MNKRFKFFSTGVNCYRTLCEEVLITAGYEYVREESEADFLLVGQDSTGHSKRPAIILSYGCIYSSVDSNMKVISKPFRESDLIVLPSTSDYFQAETIYAEAHNRYKFPNHAALRIFDVYGPSAGGYVGAYMHAMEQETPIRIQLSPHRTVSCMYEDDFKAAFLKFVEVFVGQEVRGLYNLGHDQGITFGHLADTVYQTWHGSQDKAQVEILEPNHFVNFHEVPDMTRFCALTGWKPFTSLRKGVWLTVQHEKLQRK